MKSRVGISLPRPSAVILCVLTHRADYSSLVSLFVGRQRTLSSGPFFFSTAAVLHQAHYNTRIHHCLSHTVW